MFTYIHTCIINTPYAVCFSYEDHSGGHYWISGFVQLLLMKTLETMQLIPFQLLDVSQKIEEAYSELV